MSIDVSKWSESMTIKEFIEDLKIIAEDTEYGMLFQEHRVVFRDAYFSDKGVNGYDLLDASLMDRKNLSLDEMCVFSWREDEPDRLKIRYTDLITGETKEDEIAETGKLSTRLWMKGKSGEVYEINLFEYC